MQPSIAAARLIGNHTVQVTTADGDPFEIIPAALGDYRCRLEQSTIFPCRRLD